MESLKRIGIAFLTLGLIFILVGYAYNTYGAGIALFVNMLCLGAVTAYLAHGKNRSEPAWFLIGTFTGIIGLGLIMGIKPAEKSNE
jgi:hypothetical protein